MKKIDHGQTITILANIGVIAGIIFLAVEIQQNNKLMRSQVRSDISNSIVSTLLGLAHSDYLEDIRDPSQVEQAGGLAARRQLEFEIANLRLWGNIHYLWRNGLYDDSEFEAEKQIWRSAVNLPWRRAVYCEYSDALSPEFDKELEYLLEVPC